MSEPQGTPQAPKIEGRVAQLLNARELVINVGAAAGVRKGMKFRVLADAPLEVRDPQTNAVLDTIDRDKTQVEAVEVREKIAICRTFRNVGGNLVRRQLEGMFDLTVARPETLQLKDSALPPPLPESESYVKVNDRVTSIEEK
jgi:hypothetical protein